MANIQALMTGDTKAFLDAAREGRLIFQKCLECRHVQHPPRHICAVCWTDRLETIDSGGRGRIESLTVVRRAPTPAFRGRVPYVVVAVAMDEGPRMIANLLGDDAVNARPEDPVTILFAPDADGVMLPQFQRAIDASSSV